MTFFILLTSLFNFSPQKEGVYISKLNMILVQVRRKSFLVFEVEEEGGDITLLSDPEAGMAQTLAHLHQRHRGSESDQREPLSEQHDHPQAAQ